MVRVCVVAEVPVFGICRGIQEMNVALGGSLHHRLHLLEGTDDHRMPRRDDMTIEEVFKLRHPPKCHGSMAVGIDGRGVSDPLPAGVSRRPDPVETSPDPGTGR